MLPEEELCQLFGLMVSDIKRKQNHAKSNAAWIERSIRTIEYGIFMLNAYHKEKKEED